MHASQAPETIQILADALPKIVPYVLINHREVGILVTIKYVSSVISRTRGMALTLYEVC